MIRPAFKFLSSSGFGSKLTTLIFHRVLEQRDELFPEEVTREDFDAICSWLKSWFTVVPLDEAAALLRQGRLPAGAACITFDDGYADNHDVALPILQRHGITATFFIATGFLDGGRMWNDSIIESIRLTDLAEVDLSSLGLQGISCVDLLSPQSRRAAIDALLRCIKYLPFERRAELVDEIAALLKVDLPNDLMMTRAQVRGLRHAGMGIGAHTVGHPILARLDEVQAQLEIANGRDSLEGLLNEKVQLFAYPNGKPGRDYTQRDVDLVKGLGFSAAVSTQWGVGRSSSDPHQIPRFTPWDRQRTRFCLRLLQNMQR